jgi:acetyl esterase/lipase
MSETIHKANTENIKRKFFDIAYANISPSQKLDIYLPDEENCLFPVIISIHGGAFKFGDKRDEQIIPMLQGLERGYAVVGINYRLSDEAKFPALVQDIKTAIRWVRANSKEYSFDPDRIAVWGGSAGGYLSLMAGVSSGIRELDEPSLANSDQPDNVNAVVAWFAPTNFLQMDMHLEEYGIKSPDIPVNEKHSHSSSPESLLLGQTITEVPELVRKADPATYIKKGAPPFLLQHGKSDDIVPYQQSVIFAKRASELLGKDHVTLEIIPNAGHGDPFFNSPKVLNTVYAFLEKVLR